MGYELRKNLHCCSADGRVVFLDLERDRYFCLPSRLETAFQAWIGNETSELLDKEPLEFLCGKNILTKTENTNPGGVETILNPAKAEASLIENGELRADILTTVGAISERLHCRKLLKSHPLLDILSPIAARQRQFRTVERPHQAVVVAASAFQASNRWLAAQDQCLERSVALVRYLARRRQYAQLILGVTMTPFRAHAWVQQGTLVLNDTLAKVLNYTPILVI